MRWDRTGADKIQQGRILKKKESYTYYRYHCVNMMPLYCSCGHRVAVNVTVVVQSTPVARLLYVRT